MNGYGVHAKGIYEWGVFFKLQQHHRTQFNLMCKPSHPPLPPQKTTEASDSQSQTVIPHHGGIQTPKCK